jgi:hypothetical protein
VASSVLALAPLMVLALCLAAVAVAAELRLPARTLV